MSHQADKTSDGQCLILPGPAARIGPGRQPDAGKQGRGPARACGVDRAPRRCGESKWGSRSQVGLGGWVGTRSRDLIQSAKSTFCCHWQWRVGARARRRHRGSPRDGEGRAGCGAAGRARPSRSGSPGFESQPFTLPGTLAKFLM